MDEVLKGADRAVQVGVDRADPVVLAVLEWVVLADPVVLEWGGLLRLARSYPAVFKRC